MRSTEKTYEIVIAYVKKMIMNRDLLVGEKLPPEREIAEHLQVSRNSVREAIRIMDMTGIISSQQGSGNYITCDFQKSMVETMSMMFAMDKITPNHISQVRRALEIQAFSLAVKYATEEEITQIETYVNELDAADNDDEHNAQLDKNIHYTLAKLSRNVLVIDILESLSAVVDIFIRNMRTEILNTEERKGGLNECHYRLVDALRERDVNKGIDAMNLHFDMIDAVLKEEKL